LPHKDLGEDRPELWTRYPGDLEFRGRGVAERAEEVEDCPDSNLFPHCRYMTHARVEFLRKEEAKAALVNHTRDLVVREVQVGAEGFQKVCRRGRVSGLAHLFRGDDGDP